MSGLFGSTLIKGNRITEFSDTTATVGTVIPFGYGRFTSGGNVIWAPLPPKEQRHVKRQGKGGVKQESFTYTLSYAIAFAKGPIYGYWWIKRNGKVVWTQDPNAPIEDIEYAAKWRQRATFYYGTMEQLPDSTIESYEGSGQVSAFHRLAYIVVEDDDVTEGGGAVPTYEACVIASPPEVYLTSPLYPVYDRAELGVSMPAINSAFNEAYWDELFPSMQPLNSDLDVVVRYLTYDYYDPEPVTCAMTALDSDLVVVVGYKTYDSYEPEPVTCSMEPLNSDLEVTAGYITYDNGAPDPIAVAMTPLNSDLTSV